MKPLASILTSTFRSERYLERFLAGLERQSAFGSVEVVMRLNDPSQTEVRLVDAFAKKWPDVLRISITRARETLGASWNTCIDIAEADLLAIWNVDDYRTTTSLETQMRLMERSPGAGYSYGKFGVSRRLGGRPRRFFSEFPAAQHELERGMHLGPFFMVRRETAKRIGPFDEQLKVAADMDYALRLAHASSPAHTSEYLGDFLNEGRGLSSRRHNLQALERTVVELRYGLYENVRPRYLLETLAYNSEAILCRGEWIPIEELMPEIQGLKQEARNTVMNRHGSLHRRIRMERQRRADQLEFLVGRLTHW